MDSSKFSMMWYIHLSVAATLACNHDFTFAKIPFRESPIKESPIPDFRGQF